MAALLDVDVAMVSEPVFASQDVELDPLQRRLGSSLLVQFSVTSKASSTALAAASTNSALRSNTASSDFVTYLTSKATELGAPISNAAALGVVGSMTATDSTPTWSPTSAPIPVESNNPNPANNPANSAAAAAAAVVVILPAVGYYLWTRHKEKVDKNDKTDMGEDPTNVKLTEIYDFEHKEGLYSVSGVAV